MESPQRKVSGAPLPTKKEGALFAFKAFALQRKRFLGDLFISLPRFRTRGKLDNGDKGVLLAKSVSLLRTNEDTATALIDGKIHNIRKAAKKLDGIIVPKGKIFSFWRQVGKLTKAKGYAPGRELREGCIIPTIGGGICQLTNAIYDAALKAELEIIEHHRHSQVIEGSLAELDRDATVFWNYLDLRLRGSRDWRLEVKLDKERLSVMIYGEQDTHSGNKPKTFRVASALGDCTRCGRTDCYLHTGDMPSNTRKTYLGIDEEWIEFAQWHEREMRQNDRLISDNDTSLGTKTVNFISKLSRRYHLWLGNLELRRAARYSKQNGKYLYNWRKHPIPSAQNARFSLIAKHFAKKLTASDTYLVVPQQLLVWLYLEGELGGREYDVLMNAMPMSEIERELDDAMKRYGFDTDGKIGTTLGDYRAEPSFIKAEEEALRGASRLITPHAKILKWAGDKGVDLKWILPKAIKNISKNDGYFKILLAGASLGRKGVFDLHKVLRKLDFNFKLLLPPSAVESADFWQDIHSQTVNSVKEGVALCDIAVLPAVIEHNPRGLLLAIVSQKPVIASSACGIGECRGLTIADNSPELEKSIKAEYLRWKNKDALI